MKKLKLSPDVLILFCVLIVTAFIYSGVANYGFVNWDDDENIRVNPRFTEFTTENIVYHYQQNHYKSLAIWSYMAEYQIFGSDAKAHHINNLLLHLINLVLVFVFIKKLAPKNRFAPIITAVLFGLHPAFIEPVAWVTGRKDLLFVMFAMLSLLSYLRFIHTGDRKRRHLYLMLTIALVYLSSLAKIQAFALPVVFLTIDWMLHRKINFSVILEKLIMGLFVFNIPSLGALGLIIYLAILEKQLIVGLIKSKAFAYSILLIFLCLLVVIYLGTGYSKLHILLNLPDWIIAVITLVYIIILVWKFKKLTSFLQKSTIRTKVFLLSVVVLVAFLIAYDSNYWSFSYKLKSSLNIAYIADYLTGFWSSSQGSVSYFSFWERFLLLATSLLYYFMRFFLLAGQDPMIPYPTRLPDGSLPGNMFSDLIILGVIFALTLFVLLRYFRKSRLVWFGVLFFLINIGLVLHIIPIEGRVLVADRYTYLAYVGLFLLVGMAADYFI
ncbi:MAG: hypothetical protein KA974_08580, partial [Saprospiraceae bacterium]|nr:hypothetical protein [Saprospiraceae bacterium]